MKVNRIPRVSVILILCLFSIGSVHAQGDETNVFYMAKNQQIIWWSFSDGENSLYKHIASQANALLDQRTNEVSRIETLAGWQKRQDYVKKTLKDIVGPFPGKTPLNAKIAGTIDKQNYSVEHIILESQPGFYLTSSLFIPKNLQGKAPAILHCSGHAAEAYRSEVYQHEILNLVNKGFIVYAIDPVGQGERLGYYQPETGTSVIAKATHEHSYVGAQAFTTGFCLAGYMVWDGIRALDYLLEREEVDADRIGITGRSGGGLQTALIAAIDERIHVAAPECFITNLKMVIQAIGPQDAEQNQHGFIEKGLDHADLLSVRAPKPGLMVTTINDFFSIQGARETAEEVAGVYRAYDAEGNFQMVEDQGIHESTELNREAKYAFFQKHLRNPGSAADLNVELLSMDELQVTSTGQVSTALNSESVYTLNKKRVDKLHEILQDKRENNELEHSQLKEIVQGLSGYRDFQTPPDHVFTGRILREDYTIDKYFIEGEGDYPIPFLLIRSDNASNKIIIYLHPDGKSYALENDGELMALIQNGYTVVVPDMLGTGELGPGIYKGDSYINGISYNLLFGSFILNRSITGIRAGDINRLVSWVEKELKPEDIYGFSRDQAGPDLLHAALFNPKIKRVALLNPYTSYRAINAEEIYNSNYVHSLVPAALTGYDLPDIAASLSPRKILIYNPLNGKGEAQSNEIIVEDLAIIKNGYEQHGASDKVTIDIDAAKNNKLLSDILLNWAK